MPRIVIEYQDPEHNVTAHVHVDMVMRPAGKIVFDAICDEDLCEALAALVRREYKKEGLVSYTVERKNQPALAFLIVGIVLAFSLAATREVYRILTTLAPVRPPVYVLVPVPIPIDRVQTVREVEMKYSKTCPVSSAVVMYGGGGGAGGTVSVYGSAGGGAGSAWGPHP